MGTLVSILIPCYNAERWIAQAIESALAQTWTEKEVIVVDDGSTDRSLDVIQQFQGRIRWETGPNRGGNAARNRLLKLAKGEWLQYLDADDYLLPDKITGQMEFVANHEDLDVVFGPVTLEHWSSSGIRHETREICGEHDIWVLCATAFAPVSISNETKKGALSATWGLPPTCAILWRKQAVVDVGGWKSDQPCCQDHELYLRLLIGQKRFSFCSTGGAIYRQWSSKQVSKMHKGELRRLEIEADLEDYLRATKQLTRERLCAINQARFEIARTVWHYDLKEAKRIMNQIQTLDPKFSPIGPTAPARYRLVFHSLGFQAAERLAVAVKRLTVSF